MNSHSEAAYGSLSYLVLALITAHPFMSDFQFKVILFTIIWLGVVMLSICECAGIFRIIKDKSDSYLAFGALIGIASVTYLLLINLPFDAVLDAGNPQRLSHLREFLGAIVSIFGGGVSGNLIVSAINTQRNSREKDKED